MSTTSTIAVVNTDGTVTQIYCHWDGYLEHNGRMLVNHYPTLELASKMVKKGDLSSLGTTIGRKHEFNANVECCTYYGRDRGETHTKPKKFKSLEDYVSNGRTEEYNYLFMDGIWSYAKDSLYNFKVVTDNLKSLLAA